MKFSRKMISTLLLVVVMMLLTTTMASMQGPTVQQVIMGTVTDTACTGQVSVPVNMTGVGGSGASGFTLVVGVPTGLVTLAPSCVFSGQFAASCSAISGIQICTVNDINDQGTGQNLYQVDGGCLPTGPTVPAPPVLGDTLATTITVNRNGAPQDSHVLDLLPSDGAASPTYTQIVDPAGATYNVPNAALIDGAVNWCPATAVTMSGFDAVTNNAAPFAAAAWPLLAGAAAVAAGGAYALLRRKS
jgi:hypothetical protein